MTTTPAMNDDLVRELHERAASYRLGGPSSEHTAALLEQAAKEIEALRAALEPFARAATEVQPDPREKLIVDAFLRGESWRRRNGFKQDDDGPNAIKAAIDYMDATLTALTGA